MRLKLFGGEGVRQPRYSDLDDLVLGKPVGMRAGGWPEGPKPEFQPAAKIGELNQAGRLGFELGEPTANGLTEGLKPGPEGPRTA